jgi:hypothetical protein
MHGFDGSAEALILKRIAATVLGVAVYSVVVRLWASLRRKGQAKRRWPSRRAACRFLGTLAVVAMFAWLYFWMPMETGAGHVYACEITAATLCALALLPGLPRSPWLSAPAVGALLFAVTMPARFVAGRYTAFDQESLDFQRIVRGLPLAPKLGYMVFDASGAAALVPPYIRMPAWVQAEKGGWLSFHIAAQDASPIRFKKTSPRDVAPDTPPSFESNPQMFDVATRGKYFGWFLARARSAPDAAFAVDPSIRRVDQQGTWWLYKRD